MPGKSGNVCIKKNVIEVWVVDLAKSSKALDHDYHVLSDEERYRAERFHFPRDRARFIAARVSLRKILARYLKADPSELVLRYSEYGKPRLAAPAADICFNTSRSHERALIACTCAREIGVDIEWIYGDFEIDEIAGQFFTVAEKEWVEAASPDMRRLAFLRCWTCKEAFVKAVGKGLSLELNKFDVSVALANSRAILSPHDETFSVDGWSLTAFQASEEYLSAVVARGNGMRLVVKPWLDEEA